MSGWRVTSLLWRRLRSCGTGSPVNEQTCRSLVFARAGGRCERCAGIGASYHHRKKKGQGGEWSPDNIVYLCGSGTTGCHGWIEHNPDKAETEGFHVRPWDDPEDVPIKYRRTEWIQLLPDGEVTESRPVERSDPDQSAAQE
jgi:hypothetical protein